MMAMESLFGDFFFSFFLSLTHTFCTAKASLIPPHNPSKHSEHSYEHLFTFSAFLSSAQTLSPTLSHSCTLTHSHSMAHQHQRSKSASSIDSVLDSAASSIANSSAGPGAAPLSISIPRRGSMSQSFHLATSPVTLSSIPNGNNNNSSSNSNLFLTSPISATGSSTFSGTTPPTNLSALSSSIPISISGKRFSSSFTNPLTMGSPPNGLATGHSQDDRSRRTSLFGSTGTSPPFSRLPVTSSSNEIPGHHLGNPHESGGGGGNGGGGGIGGLFRKFSASNRGAVASTPLSMDKNEPGPHIQFGHPENNHTGPAHPLHNAHLDVKKSAAQDSRSNSPMRSMILNGQMLD